MRSRFRPITDENAYALEISGDSMEPAYRDGTVIIVSPSASIRRRDRVVVKTRDGEVIGQGTQAPHREVDRIALDQSGARRAHLPMRDVLWIARIVWASQ